jgi:hypothetical protein
MEITDFFDPARISIDAVGHLKATSGASMGIPAELGAAVWLPVLALSLGCALLLLGLILSQKSPGTLAASCMQLLRRSVRRLLPTTGPTTHKAGIEQPR